MVAHTCSPSCSHRESVCMPKPLFKLLPCSFAGDYSAIHGATAASRVNTQPPAGGDVPPSWRTEHLDLNKAAGGTALETERLCCFSDPLKSALLPPSFSSMSLNTPSLGFCITDQFSRHFNLSFTPIRNVLL